MTVTDGSFSDPRRREAARPSFFRLLFWPVPNVFTPSSIHQPTSVWPTSVPKNMPSRDVASVNAGQRKTTYLRSFWSEKNQPPGPPVAVGSSKTMAS